MNNTRRNDSSNSGNKRSSKTARRPKTIIGIIGSGGMVHFHAQGFRAAGAEVAAISGRRIATVKAVAAREGIPLAFDSVEKMLAACPQINAISIVTPNKFHAPFAIKALKAGKHVYCEKPPALNTQETRAMVAAAKKARRVLLFAFNNRARPESLAMLDFIKRGGAGRINSVQAKWTRRAGIPGLGGWFTNKALSGGGPVIDLLHMLDLALHFMGYPEPEWALAQTFSDFIGDKNFKGRWGRPDVRGGVADVENACHGFIRFKNGQVLTLQSSWAELVEHPEEIFVSFQGVKAGGTVRQCFSPDAKPCEIYVQEKGKSVNRGLRTTREDSMGRIPAAANFVNVVEGRSKPLTGTPDEAILIMRIIDAIYKSARTGKPARC